MALISVVIPHLRGVQGADEALKICVQSMTGQASEIIVLANDGLGYGPAVNAGMELTSGDHIIIANNDTHLAGGLLKQICFSDAVGVPRILPEPRDHNPRCFFSVPRWVYDELVNTDGFFFDPRFEGGYWEDDDLIRRLELHMISIRYLPKVFVDHENGGGMTMKWVGEKEHYDKNKKVFDNKWN